MSSRTKHFFGNGNYFTLSVHGLVLIPSVTPKDVRFCRTRAADLTIQLKLNTKHSCYFCCQRRQLCVSATWPKELKHLRSRSGAHSIDVKITRCSTPNGPNQNVVVSFFPLPKYMARLIVSSAQVRENRFGNYTQIRAFD